MTGASIGDHRIVTQMASGALAAILAAALSVVPTASAEPPSAGHASIVAPAAQSAYEQDARVLYTSCVRLFTSKARKAAAAQGRTYKVPKRVKRACRAAVADPTLTASEFSGTTAGLPHGTPGRTAPGESTGEPVNGTGNPEDTNTVPGAMPIPGFWNDLPENPAEHYTKYYHLVSQQARAEFYASRPCPEDGTGEPPGACAEDRSYD